MPASSDGGSGGGSSFGSSSFGGSFGGHSWTTGQSGAAAGPRTEQTAEDLYSANQSVLTTGIFGLVYTVSKERKASYTFTAFKFIMDFLQLYAMMCNPQFGWTMDTSNKMQQIIQYIQIQPLMVELGYTAFLVLMYVFLALLLVVVAACCLVFHQFKQGKFTVWPVLFLRVFGLIFFQVLDIMSLSLFLTALDCTYYRPPDGAKQFENMQFPAEVPNCFSGTFIVHVAMAAIGVVIFIALAGLFWMGEMTLDPASRMPDCQAHSLVEIEGFALKVLMTLSQVFLNDYQHLAVMWLTCTILLFIIQLKWVPMMFDLANHLRVGTYTSILYIACLFMAMQFPPEFVKDDPDPNARYDYNKKLETALWGILPAFLTGMLMSYLRLHYFRVYVLNKFKTAPLGARARSIHVFSDAREVEIVARCCRVWLPNDDTRLDPDAVALSERVIKCGLAQLPKSAFMTIWYSSFLIDVLGSYQSGYTQLQTAKQLTPSFLERFAIFCREQEHTQKAASGIRAGQAMDLVAFVELNKNLRAAMAAHREALVSLRRFWQLLLHSHVPFKKLTKAVRRIDKSVRHAEKVYRSVLQRHGTNARLIRAYAKFLERVKRDPFTASRWHAEADKMDRQEETAKTNNMLGIDVTGEGNGEPGAGAGHGLEDAALVARMTMGTDGRERGVIVTNAQAMIQLSNQAANDMFGYSRTELKGKNATILMPPGVAEHHAGYVRAFIESGRTSSSVVNKTVQLLGLHKDRRLFPISMTITRISGIGEDSTFLAVMESVQPDPDVAVAYVMANGQVLTVDASFTDWLGYRVHDLVDGALLGSLMPQAQAKHLEELMRMARTNLMLTSAVAAAQDHQAANGVPAQPLPAMPRLGPMAALAPMALPALPGAAAAGAARPTAAGTQQSCNIQAAQVLATQAMQRGAALRGGPGAPCSSLVVNATPPEPGVASLQPPASPALQQQQAGGSSMRAGGNMRDSRETVRSARQQAQRQSQQLSSETEVDERSSSSSDSMDRAARPQQHQQPQRAVSKISSFARRLFSSRSITSSQRQLQVPAAIAQPPQLALASGNSAATVSFVRRLPDRHLSELNRNNTPSLRSGTITDALEAAAAAMASASAAATAAPVWVLPRVPIYHRYCDPVVCDVVLTHAGVGRYQFFAMQLRKPGAAEAVVAAASAPGTSSAIGITPYAAQLAANVMVQPLQVVSRPLMMVADTRGRLLHVTEALAAMLGSTPRTLMANGLPHALEALIPSPFAQMHRVLGAALPPTPPPPYSCRTGLSMPLVVRGNLGRDVVPFKLQIKRRVNLDEMYHVVTLQPTTAAQMLDDRRIRVRIDPQGNVTEVLGHTPAELFGFQPHLLQGASASSFIDALRPCPDTPASQNLNALLVSLARRARDQPNYAVRVGVHPPLQGNLMALPNDPHASSLVLQHTRPALLRVVLPTDLDEEDNARLGVQGAVMPTVAIIDAPFTIAADANMQHSNQLFYRQDERDGCVPPAPTMAQHDMQLGAVGSHQGSRQQPHQHHHTHHGHHQQHSGPIHSGPCPSVGGGSCTTTVPTAGGAMHPLLRNGLVLEIWRSDLVTSVVELDPSARIVYDEASTLWPPGLALGTSEAAMLGRHLSVLLPVLQRRSLGDLFKNGTFGVPPATIPMASKTTGAGRKRGVLKQTDKGADVSKAGPVHLMQVPHFGDARVVSVLVQAVRKSGGLYVVIRPFHPESEMVVVGRQNVLAEMIAKSQHGFSISRTLAAAPALLAGPESLEADHALPDTVTDSDSETASEVENAEGTFLAGAPPLMAPGAGGLRSQGQGAPPLAPNPFAQPLGPQPPTSPQRPVNSQVDNAPSATEMMMVMRQVGSLPRRPPHRLASTSSRDLVTMVAQRSQHAAAVAAAAAQQQQQQRQRGPVAEELPTSITSYRLAAAIDLSDEEGVPVRRAVEAEQQAPAPRAEAPPPAPAQRKEEQPPDARRRREESVRALLEQSGGAPVLGVSRSRRRASVGTYSLERGQGAGGQPEASGASASLWLTRDLASLGQQQRSFGRVQEWLMGAKAASTAPPGAEPKDEGSPAPAAAASGAHTHPQRTSAARRTTPTPGATTMPAALAAAVAAVPDRERQRRRGQRASALMVEPGAHNSPTHSAQTLASLRQDKRDQQQQQPRASGPPPGAQLQRIGSARGGLTYGGVHVLTEPASNNKGNLYNNWQNAEVEVSPEDAAAIAAAAVEARASMRRRPGSPARMQAVSSVSDLGAGRQGDAQDLSKDGSELEQEVPSDVSDGGADEHSKAQAAEVQRPSYVSEQSSDSTAQDLMEAGLMRSLEDAETYGTEDEELKYNQGRRFKKLLRMLGSAAVQRSIRRFYLHAMGVCVGLMLISLALFITVYMLLETKRTMVQEMNNACVAARRMVEIAITVRNLNWLLGNVTVPWLPKLSNAATDLPLSLDFLERVIAEFSAMHAKTFFRDTEMPEFIRIWKEPSLNVTEFRNVPVNGSGQYEFGAKPVEEYVMTNLWDTGKEIASAATYLWANGKHLQQDLGIDISTTPQYMYIDRNTMYVASTAYLETLDLLTQIVIDTTQDLNMVQIIFLCVQGVFVSTAAMSYIWFLATAVFKQRYRLFSTFVSVPSSLIRNLALQRFNLGDGSDDSDDEYVDSTQVKKMAHENELGERKKSKDKDGESRSRRLRRTKSTAERKEKDSGKDGSEDERPNAGGRSQDDEEGLPRNRSTRKSRSRRDRSKRRSGFVRAWSKFTRIVTRSVKAAVSTSKSLATMLRHNRNTNRRTRRLIPSMLTTVLLTLPFLAYAVVVITCNAVGYVELQEIAAPIATQNLVNFVIVRFQRQFWRVQEVSWAQADTAPNTTEIVWADSQFNVLHESEIVNTAELSLKEKLRHEMFEAINYLQQDYKAALYGREAVPTETSKHFTRAETGVTQAGGRVVDILYYTTECLCEDKADCQPPDSQYYTVTRNGLDRVMMAFDDSIDNIVKQTGNDPTLEGPDFALLWNIKRDLEGGLFMLSQSYYDVLKQAFDGVINIHIANFSVCWAIMLLYMFFVLRPFMGLIRSETRRCAELLSQLPAHVDVEGLIQRCMLLTSSTEIKVAAVAPSGAASDAGVSEVSASAASTALMPAALLKPGAVQVHVPQPQARMAPPDALSSPMHGASNLKNPLFAAGAPNPADLTNERGMGNVLKAAHKRIPRDASVPLEHRGQRTPSVASERHTMRSSDRPLRVSAPAVKYGKEGPNGGAPRKKGM